MELPAVWPPALENSASAKPSSSATCLCAPSLVPPDTMASVDSPFSEFGPAKSLPAYSRSCRQAKRLDSVVGVGAGPLKTALRTVQMQRPLMWRCSACKSLADSRMQETRTTASVPLSTWLSAPARRVCIIPSTRCTCCPTANLTGVGLL